MRKLSTLFFLLFISFIYAQSKSGYYITNNGQRVNGVFLDADYLDASTLKFKSVSDESFKSLDVAAIKEFGIGENIKAVKFTVQVDVSDAGQNQASVNKDAIWEKQTLFLNVVVEGDASLYLYDNGRGKKFFYKVEGKQFVPEQLLYRKYMSENLKTSENNKYRQQLYTDLNCTGASDLNKFLNISYTKREIVPIFEAFNECKNSDSKVFNNDTNRNCKVYYSIFAGLYNARFNVDGADRSFTDDKYAAFNVGAELLVMFPSDKFGLFIKAEYETINTSISNKYTSPYGGVTTTTTIYSIKGGIFNFYMGPRFNFNLNEKSKLYADVAVVVGFPLSDLNRSVSVINNTSQYDSVNIGEIGLDSTISGNIGVGYTFRNKYSVEARYNANRDFLNRNRGGVSINSTTLGLNLKYTIN